MSPQHPRIVMTGIGMGESPRWHEGRLWLADWAAQEVVALDLDGVSEVVTRVRSLPFSIDWLPDGPMLITSGTRILRLEPDGSQATQAELGDLSPYGWNEIVVDGRGNAYVNNICFAFGEEEFRPGIVAVVTPGGSARQVADGLAFPNGMVVTPDNSTLIVAESYAGRLTAYDIADEGGLSNRRVWAELGGAGAGDGICLDAEGAVWTSAAKTAMRVREGGEVLETFELEHPCFACMLGGHDGKTLFMVTNDWRMEEEIADNMRRLTTGPRTGRVVTAPAPAPAAGWP
jgi:sugar lactone lactonase YvrE